MSGAGETRQVWSRRRVRRAVAALVDRAANSLAAAGAAVRDIVRGPADRSRSTFAVLGRRLVVTNLVVAAVVLTVLSAGMYAYEDYTAVSQLDGILSQVANHGGGFNFGSGGGGQNGPPPGDQTPGGIYTPNRPDVFTVLLAADREVVEDDARVAKYGLPDWGAAGQVLSGRQVEIYVTVQRGAYSFRLYTRPVVVDNVIIGAVQTGSSLTQVDRQMRDLVRVLALLGVGVLALTTVSSVYLTERALAPARASYARQRQFTAGASHELRTPLAFIRSQAELIAGASAAGAAGDQRRAGGTPEGEVTSDKVASDEVTSDAREIITEVDYMSRLVTDLLVLARDEHDQAQLNWSTVDVVTLAEDAAARVRPVAEARGLALSVGPARAGEPVDRVLVRGDADRLRQLSLILLDNAVRYTPGGGTVRVDVKAVKRPHLAWDHAGQAVLSVTDTGAGIATEHQEHIFEPFYRAVATHGQRPAEGSTGLGLALAQWIVQAHRGTISVKSDVGSGSTFTVTLPLVADRGGDAHRE